MDILFSVFFVRIWRSVKIRNVMRVIKNMMLMRNRLMVIFVIVLLIINFFVEYRGLEDMDCVVCGLL